MKKISGLVISALLVGCGGAGLNSEGASSASNAPVDLSFYQHWVHSHEEQNGQATPNIFRPKGSREFGPSRFRMEYGFDRSGQCNYKVAGANDIPEMRSCVYTKVGNSVYLYDTDGKRLSHLAFTIESVNQGEMRFAYGVAAPSPDKKIEKK